MSIGEKLTAGLACFWMARSALEAYRIAKIDPDHKKLFVFRVVCIVVVVSLFILANVIPQAPVILLFYIALCLAAVLIVIQEIRAR